MSFFNQHIKHDTCVCCGAYVPEGRQVCISCELKNAKPRGEFKAEDDLKIVLRKCLLCYFWQPIGKTFDITRCGADCLMTGKKTKLHDVCWGWKICSPSQLEKRKKTGLIEEVKGNE